MRIKYIIFFLFSIVSSNVKCANILAFFLVPSVSHQYVFQSIWRELSLRGHKVTVITPNPLHDPKLTNLTEIDVSFVYQLFAKYDFSNLRRETQTVSTILTSFQEFFRYTFESEVSNDEVQSIFNMPEGTFDLIIIDDVNTIAYGLHHKMKAPIIGISTTPLSFYFHYTYGNPVHPVLYPDLLTEYFGDLTISQKIDSLADRSARSYFGEDMPFIEEIVKDSVTFVNVNPVFSDRRPNVPNIVEFSGVHLGRAENISNDLQQILDNAKNGVVYFSLGTNVRFDHVEKDFKNTVLRTLGELPYTVLCKWESEDYPGKPKNVVLRKWFPQQSVLAHPNIKVFVTQGGLQSSEEAIINAVPLVIIPFLGDQPMNARILTSHGMAETIQPNKLTREDLKETIMKVATEEKYHTRAKELREIFLDQPQSGLDKIVWWCEYVIRHKGAKHLRSPGADIPLYEYFMLDLLAVFIAALLVFYMVVKQLFKLMKYSFQYIKQKKD